MRFDEIPYEVKLKALDDSIAHWERMHADPGCGETPDAPGCAMCQLPMIGCTQCPIKDVGWDTCSTNPWNLAAHVFYRMKDFDIGSSRWEEASSIMIGFLKDVRVEFVKQFGPDNEDK